MKFSALVLAAVAIASVAAAPVALEERGGWGRTGVASTDANTSAKRSVRPLSPPSPRLPSRPPSARADSSAPLSLVQLEERGGWGRTGVASTDDNTSA